MSALLETFERELSPIYSANLDRALKLVRQEAERNGVGIVGLEHLLCGLIMEESIVSLLVREGVPPEKLRSLNFPKSKGDNSFGTVDRNFTARCAILLAIDEAENAGQKEVLPTHLLGAIVDIAHKKICPLKRKWHKETAEVKTMLKFIGFSDSSSKIAQGSPVLRGLPMK